MKYLLSVLVLSFAFTSYAENLASRYKAGPFERAHKSEVADESKMPGTTTPVDEINTSPNPVERDIEGAIVKPEDMQRSEEERDQEDREHRFPQELEPSEKEKGNRQEQQNTGEDYE